MPVPSESSLPPSCQRLVELMRRLHFGRIEGLRVRDGQPVLDPPPRIVREFKFGSEDLPRPGGGHGESLLKMQMRDFFVRLTQLGDAVVLTLEVKHGLPFRMTVEDSLA